ncbi:MAG: hypothetical protein E7480_02020 [Ruminococcaceae bacterium]|nr:hypothetical protein [Oscillospiraceae bacterium]
MSLVSITGDVSVFDSVAKRCIEKEIFHAENAADVVKQDEYISVEDSGAYSQFELKFSPFSEQNPYSETLREITDFASRTGIELKYSDFEGVEKTPEEIQDRIKGINDNYDIFLSSIHNLEKRLLDDEQILLQLTHLKNFSVDIHQLLSFKFIKYRFGRMPKENYTKLLAHLTEGEMYFVTTSEEKESIWGFYFATPQSVRRADSLMSTLNFERIELSGRVRGTPEEAHENFENELKETKKELEDMKLEFEAFMEEAKTGLLKYYSKIRCMHDVFALRKYALRSNDTFLLTGWVPQKNTEELTDILKEYPSVKCAVDKAETHKDLTPPTKLKNIKFVNSFESFVKLYGMPSYNEIDPSFIFALTYTIVFGLMFGDIGQGFVLFLAGLFAWLKLKKNFGQMLSLIGLSSICFGFVYGSFFGYEDIIHGVLIPMKNINTMLFGAVGIGVVIIVAGMTVNVINCILKKEYAKAFFSSNGIAGIVFYTSLLAGVALTLFMGINVFSLAYILGLIVLPVLLFVLCEPFDHMIKHKTAFKPESWGDFLIEAFFELFEIVLSFVTNTISFIRIGAFALSHAGMMMIVLSLAGAGEGPGNILVIILGNAFVMCIEGLIVGIQTLRLEFYEMFSRFYEGNGDEFTPVKIQY